MVSTDLNQDFDPLYASFVNLADVHDGKRPPHLAHYTSLEVLEKIIQFKELWFSNPLFMNDHHEMRFGLFEGAKILNDLGQDAALVSSIQEREDFSLLLNAYQSTFQEFDANYAFDIYAFCLSEYDYNGKPDGLLSMWRGYGANGQGAAVVFDTSYISVVPGSPLIIGKVQYAPIKERRSWMEMTLRRCLDVFRHVPVSKEALRVTGFHMFQLMLIYSLMSKDPGFEEEQEWRVIYLPFRDTAGPENKGVLKDKRSYLRRNNMIEPKLHFPIEPLNLEPRQTWTFDDIVARIVLGPTHATPLAMNAAMRMFQSLGMPNLSQKLWVSGIPYRPTGG